MTPSKRTPAMSAGLNEADIIEALLKKDEFKKWGFVIYRCTYQNNSDWEKFMARFLKEVTNHLESYSGLDLLDTYTPTVLEDPSFEGATAATLPNGRYRFFIAVDQEAMESVLNVPEDSDIDETGFVRMIYGEWEPEVLDEEDIANGHETEAEEPIEGCTLHDVGWMKMSWRWVVLPGFHKMRSWDDWETYYARPPEIGDID
ncbi:unnamed protein product [Penicillium manginii]